MPKIEKDLTPPHLRCSWGGCQAVHLLSDGNFLVIGKKPPEELANEVEGKVADDEYAIVLDAQYLGGILNR